MKRSFFALFALASLTMTPGLLALDEGGDGAYIPSAEELSRMGYGSGGNDDGYNRVGQEQSKPTQAFHYNGMTIYYSYTPVPARNGYNYGNPRDYYAFGYPVDYFREKMPASVTTANLDQYAVAVVDTTHATSYGPVDYLGGYTEPHTAITYVKPAGQSTVQNVASSRRAATTPGSSKIAMRATQPVPAKLTAIATTTGTTAGAAANTVTGPAALPPIADKLQMLPPIGEKLPDSQGTGKGSH